MRALPSLAAVALAGCATTAIMGDPAVTVTAQAETKPVGTSAADAADDPAIWRNAADPAGSLIVATDKKAGLHVYALDGSERSFAPGGLLNNVDLVDMGAQGIIVVASDRNDPLQAKMQVYRLDPASAGLTLLGTVPVGSGEAYGMCLTRRPDGLHAVAVLKDGRIEQMRLDLDGTVSANRVLTRKVPTQAEGCVVDERDGTLYVGEEDAGIWRFADGATAGEIVAPIDNRQLVADVEGLAITPDGYLVASSQGDNAYALFRLPGMEPAGRFRIVMGQVGAVEETDGIALDVGSFGADYPGGLFIAQDGRNEPAAQNFKFVSWAAIKDALGLQ